MKELSLVTDFLTTRVKGIFRTKCLSINGLVRGNGFSSYALMVLAVRLI